MGSGLHFRCRECGKEGDVSLDVGMFYPQYCAMVKENAAKGDYGKRAMIAVQENPEGVFDCTRVIYKCDCGYWRDDEKLLYCIPKKPAEDCYGELNGRNSRIVWKRRHLCPRCRKELTRYKGSLWSLKCPECGGKVDFSDFRMWD